MPKHSKRFKKILASVDTKKNYTVTEALELLKQNANVKFVPSVDIAVKLNLNTTKPEQQLRGTFTLPHTVAKEVRVLVIDDAFTKEDAEKCGADHYGSVEKIDEIKQGWMEFDLIITTAKMMPQLAKIGKILGPKGLMPNPKLGTVTNDVVKTVIEFKKGKSEYRTDSFGNIHMQIGKADFTVEQLSENFDAVMQLLIARKPSVVKGTYIQNISLSTTMGPGLKIQF
ncbi:large subunit ribosomal protein L1 [Mycoplasmoides fastidiosum]|uniref:Large ribosomal subunit protein uL1 n=1 Tax=Mycoplasmoides fastidiosum TaxID=92758 RepID=A0ABU0LZH1_9BACT|nr:50S ribosomal protein L1 [Mycoplasmoides fastidiosum]MDQ0514082.1 large subunit ribosomal protein L1 [Mycoplasmoides fastidiosum]UUD37508.1 50S ribosomal protein L1 [Mycoplasmoides fastidiosum]